MNPSYTHEALLHVLSHKIIRFTDRLGHDEVLFNLHSCLNSSITYTKADGSERHAIPDYQLVLGNNNFGVGSTSLTPKWIGQVSFTVPPIPTRTQLKQIVTSCPTYDLAFMVTIEESPRWKSPNSNNAAAERLRSQPLLNQVDFIPRFPVDDFGRVVVEGLTWMSISKVTFEAYLRRPDGSLLVDATIQDEFSAFGVYFILSYS